MTTVSLMNPSPRSRGLRGLGPPLWALIGFGTGWLLRTAEDMEPFFYPRIGGKGSGFVRSSEYFAEGDSPLRPNYPQQTRPGAAAAACSCWNTSADDRCCSRAMLKAHKFGVVLGRKFSEALGVDDRSLPRPFFDPKLVPKDGGPDYRHIAIVREVAAAVVSGYLYHRSGHECWINPDGIPLRSSRERNVPWYEWLVNTSKEWPSPRPPWLEPSRFPFPHGWNRTMCQYLLDEDEETGMIAYATYVMSYHYGGIIPYLRRAEERDRRDGVPQRRTLVVCLEEASDPLTQSKVLQHMADFLFPGGLPHLSFPSNESDSNGGSEPPGGPVVEGPGGHATERDDGTRNRLRELVLRLDREIFGGAVQGLSGQWNCSESYR